MSRYSGCSSVTVFRFLHITSLRPLKNRTIDLKLIIKMPHPVYILVYIKDINLGSMGGWTKQRNVYPSVMLEVNQCW